jgi:exodeoxyribonuclease-3
VEKTERKKTWIQRFGHALQVTASDVPVLLLGDLDVLEPTHQPAHRGQFAPFEYAFYTGLTDRHGLVDLFRHLHPDGGAANVGPATATTHTEPELTLF